jgi:spermidine/putrescine transport system permease protein
MTHRRLGWLAVPLAFALFFLYFPIVVVMGMAFNSSKSPYSWSGFSFRWFEVLANDQSIIEGAKNTLIVAVGATLLATLLGTLLGVGLKRYTRSRFLAAYSIGPAILPDIVMAIGLLSLFGVLAIPLGLHSVLLAHVTFGMAFVAAIVQARMTQDDIALEEASRDLGAGPVGTFVRVTVPSLAPAIVAGALLVFTLSVDEFVLAFFTNGPSTPTLPIVIYSMVKFGITPEINALAVILMVISFVAVIGAQRLTRLTDSV